MNVTKEDTDFIVAAIRRYFPKSVEIFFFGSRVGGTARKWSDLDVLIKRRGGPVDLGKLSLVKEIIEESNLPFKVDILDYHRCSKTMIKNASKNIVKITTA